jgi:4-hydroxy-3-methylbut-2-enyl diphosphate reductase IspH
VEHINVEIPPVGLGDVGYGYCLQVQSAIVQLSDLLVTKLGRGNNHVHNIAVVDSLDGRNIFFVEFDGRSGML